MAVITAVHGDEPVGVLALEELLPTLRINRGKLLCVIANPSALKRDVRFVDQNLNRSLVSNPPQDTNEGRLAKALMEILDSTDACLDIHAGMDGEPPFVICEENSFDITRRMPVEIFSTGWIEAEPGSTDEYMYRHGKPALCIECGDRREAESMNPLAIETIRQFLSHFGMIDWPAVPSHLQQVAAVRYPVFKRSKAFAFTRKFTGFERLVPGELIVSDGVERYFAPEYPASIIFTWPEAPVGAEAFLVAESIK